MMNEKYRLYIIIYQPPSSKIAFTKWQYFIYFEGKSGALCKLTPHTIAKIGEYCKKWIDLDGEQSTIAANIAERIKRWSLHSETELVQDEIASEIANA